MRFLDINVDMNKLLEQLATYAAPLAKHGWEILVRQQYIHGIQNLIWSGALLILVVVSYFMGRNFWKWARTVHLDSEDEGMQYIPVVLVWVAAIIMVYMSIWLAS